jgi:peptidoglycan/xylan/chitin deacetylase (PgdA/CDA1 family)
MGKICAMNRAKKFVLRILTQPAVTACLRPLTRDRVTVFMLHRLANPDLGVRGHDPALLRRNLATLRRRKHNIISLQQLVQTIVDGGPPLTRTVVFTIDDGYREQAEIAAPIFAEFDCPVTTFVITGFLDRELWLWWDEIEHIFETTGRRELGVTLAGTELRYGWMERHDLAAAIGDFTERCKRVPDDERRAAIRRLAEEADVEIPAAAPPRYAPMTWDQLRACERQGMTFGPHTVSHPILSRASDERSRKEIERSWLRLRDEAQSPVPVFCYPNGCPGDFGPREVGTIRRLGLAGAVVVNPDYVDVDGTRAEKNAIFKLSRFGYEDDPRLVLYFASGCDRLRR